MKRNALLFLLFIAFRGMAQNVAPIPSGAYHWADIPVTKSEGREGRKFMQGSTAELSYLEIHATTQARGVAPRPSHAQTDIEEIIYVKEGTMKFTMGADSKVLGKGSLVLVPPHVEQATQNVGDGPLTYYVIQLRAKKPMDMERSAKGGGPLMLSFDSVKYVPTAKGGGIKYINRPTAMLDNLEMHVTELKGKGPAHVPHTHVDTELTLVLEGNTEMVIEGKTYHAGAGDIYLMNSNELHGISNPTDVPCKYLAIRWK